MSFPRRHPAADSLAVAVLLTALVAFGPISTDLYLASLPDMGRHFGAEPAVVQLTLSAFLGGFALMQLAYGPISDRFGRRPAILWGVAIYVAASLFCMVAPTIEALIAGRVLQAVGACCGPVLGRAVVRDVYPREQAAKVLSYMASAMSVAPFVAPIAGGWVHSQFGWRSNFVLMALFGVMLLGLVWRILGETNTQPDALALRPGRLARNYALLFTDRRYLGYTVVVALAFGGLFTFISASSFVLIDVLGMPPARFGFAFAVVVSGYMLGGYLSGRLTGRVGIDRLIGLGCLGCFVTGGVMAGLAFAGIATLAAVLAPMTLFFLSTALVLPNATAGAVAPFARMAGTASAGIGFVQMLGAAAAGWLVAAVFDGTTRPLALVVFGLGTAALAAYLLMVRGHKVD